VRERIGRPAHPVPRQIGAAPQHLRRWRPGRPFRLARDLLDAGPHEARTANADPVANCAPLRLHEVEELVLRIDDNRARPLPAVILDLLSQIDRFHAALNGCVERTRRFIGSLAIRRIVVARVSALRL
jgi:hypothetical protein